MESIEWQEIGYDSKAINRIGYSEGNLYVEFKNGTGYYYLNVPIEIFHRILNKECISVSEGKSSYGATLHQLVKKAGYEYKQYK